MKTTKILILLLAATLTACSSEEGTGGNTPTEKTDVSGTIEKGPFVQGSKVTLYDLDSNMTPTGRQFATTTSDDLGHFSFGKPIQLSGRYAEVETSGYFYNECDSSLSASQITLRAITDLSRRNSVNVNIATHLEYDRVKQLIANGTPFDKAKTQAEEELMRVFAIPHTMTSPESTSLTSADDNATALLAISAIMLAERTEAQVTELLAKFCTDFKDNGTIDSKLVRDSIAAGQKHCHPSAITHAMTRFYAEKGTAVQVNDFTKFIDFNGDGIINTDDKEEESIIDNPSIVLPDVSWTDKEDNVRSIIAMIYGKTAEYIRQQIEIDRRRLNDSHLPLRPTDSDINQAWETAYTAIRYANNIIYALERRHTDYNPDPYISEAYALKAFLYYNMATAWGTIVNITPDMAIDENAILRATPLPTPQAYDECLRLLQYADALTEEPQHISRDFTLALQAELYLTMADRSMATHALSSISRKDADIFSITMPHSTDEPTMSIGIYTASYINRLRAEAKGDTPSEKDLLAHTSEYGTYTALLRCGHIKGTHERLLPIPAQELLSNPKLKQNQGY